MRRPPGEELKPYIKSYIPMEGNGGYKIILRKPVKVVLADQPFEANLEQVKAAILKANQTTNKRLIITHQQVQQESYYTKLLGGLIHDLSPKYFFSLGFDFENVENGMQLRWGEDENEDKENLENGCRLLRIGDFKKWDR